MAEYIERAAAIKALGERPLNWDDKPDEAQAVWDYDLHRSAILSVRAADVAPVVHGRWIVTDVITCSECQHFTRSEFAGRWNYCPNCGARMDKEDEHEISE